MLHAARYDDPEKLSRHAITVLEKHLRDRYGLRIPIGIELEFATTGPREGKFDDLSLPDSQSRGWLPQQLEPACKKKIPLGFFQNSPYLAYIYSEDDGTSSHYKCELVFSHKPGFSSSPSLKYLADEIISKRQQLAGKRARCPSAAKLMRPSPTDNRPLTDYFAHVHFNPTAWDVPDSNSRCGFTNGMHINYDLVDHQTGLSLFAPFATPDRDMTNLSCITRQQMWNLFQENIWLIAPAEANYRRFSERDASFSQLEERDGYVENMLPAANSNPYYGLLLTLASIAAALVPYDRIALEEKSVLDPPDGPIPYVGLKLPNSLEEAADRFRNGSQLRTILNQLEPALGDRFHTAIVRTPPGQENNAYHHVSIGKFDSSRS